MAERPPTPTLFRPVSELGLTAVKLHDELPKTADLVPPARRWHANSSGDE